MAGLPNQILNWRELMFTAYVMVTLLAAGFIAWAAYVDFARAEWVIANMTKYGIPHSWLFPLGTIKAVGAIGLVIGIGLVSDPFLFATHTTLLVLPPVWCRRI
jgi:hypothetical protein